MVSKRLRQEERKKNREEGNGGGWKARALKSLFLSHLAGSQRRRSKIEETSPLSTDLTVILCYPLGKIKVRCIHRFTSVAPEATGKSAVLHPMAAGFWAAFLLSRSLYKLRELHFLQESLSLLAFSWSSMGTQSMRSVALREEGRALPSPPHQVWLGFSM